MMMESMIGRRRIILLLAICEDDQYNHSWYEIWERDKIEFAIYLGHSANYSTIQSGSSWIFILFKVDNLNIYCNPEMLEPIADAGHHYIFWEHCWSCDGAIEYVFNMIPLYLLLLYPKVKNMNDLEVALKNIIENDLGLFSECSGIWVLEINFNLIKYFTIE